MTTEETKPPRFFTLADEHDDELLIAELGALCSVYPVLRYFGWQHLPAYLRPVSRTFAALALDVARRRPEGHPETTVALRKLLEAKDATVRAELHDHRHKYVDPAAEDSAP